MQKLITRFWLFGVLFLGCLAKTPISQAQITSDGTLSTEVTTSDNANFTIRGGKKAGGNLFHSFSEFSVHYQKSAIFDNALDVENIISRITGSSISKIDGLIKANGNANLFLVNPNGIIFNANAHLEIGGSFIASSAESLIFEERTEFSTKNTSTIPTLTITVPIGLQYGVNPGLIVSRSNFQTPGLPPAGLQVQSGKTLALVGGNITLENGFLTTYGGRIELGSVSDNSFVSLKPMLEGWKLGYEKVDNFQKVELFNFVVDTTDYLNGLASGSTNLSGKEILITGDSDIIVNNFNRPGKNILINASNYLEISHKSSLVNITLGSAKAGDIIIKTKQLLVEEETEVLASTQSQSSAGNVIINSSESIQIDGGLSQAITRISTQASSLSQGNAGDVSITTKKLILERGGRISASTFGTGDGGNVFVNASELVELSGKNINGTRSSSLFASSENENSGKAGNMAISTGNLIVRDGAKISTTGNKQEAGNLDIIAGSMQLRDGGELVAESSSGNGGNIRLKIADNLLMSNGSNISTNAGTEETLGDGGSITIDLADGVLFAVPPDATTQDSNITANAFEGSGGRIDIKALGIIGIAQQTEDIDGRNDITASSEFGEAGSINIDTTRVDLNKVPAPIAPITTEVAQVCQIDRDKAQSQFILTGRGGLPPNPKEVLSNDAVQVDWVSLNRNSENAPVSVTISDRPKNLKNIIEATGWAFNPQGKVILIADAATTGNSNLSRSLNNCEK
jgi:filamentous hemagglutinin family protein